MTARVHGRGGGVVSDQAMFALFRREGHSAVISDCGRYRYELRRVWKPEKPVLMFVMLNPSTADAERDDPTIRRCIGFAEDRGYGGLLVGNLFAFRATDPNALYPSRTAIDRVGPDCDHYLLRMMDEALGVVAAWGAHPRAADRASQVLAMTDHWRCLGATKDGHPRHPLYVPKTQPFVPYTPTQGENR